MAWLHWLNDLMTNEGTKGVNFKINSFLKFIHY